MTIQAFRRSLPRGLASRASTSSPTAAARPSTGPGRRAMWLCSRLTTHSLAAIGRQFGMRDHTTVSHAIAVVERLMRTDPVFARHVLALLESVDSEESVDVRRAMMWRAAA